MANNKSNFLNNINPNILLIVAGGWFTYTYIVRPITDKLGITKSADQQANDAAPTLPGNAWSSSFYNSGPPQTLLLHMSDALNYAKIIYDYPGLFSDNYSAVLGVFQQMKTKSQVSFLCDVFQKKYGTSLYQFLQDGGGILAWDGLSTDHLKQINQLVNNLPNYTV